MQRHVYRHRIVTGDPVELGQRLRAELPLLLARAGGRAPNPPSGDGSFTMVLPARVAGADVGKDVRVWIGTERSAPGRTVLPLRWRSDLMPHTFPTFDGSVELEAIALDCAQLSVIGSYSPPAGALGAALDGAWLHGVAEGTIEVLVDGLAHALTDPTATTPAAFDRAVVHVGDVMAADPLVVDEDMPLGTAALLLARYQVAEVPVVDLDGHLVGVLTEKDLLQQRATRPLGRGGAARRQNRLHHGTTAGAACSRPPRVTSSAVTVRDAAAQMHEHDVASLVVVDEGRIAGVIRRRDVLAVLVRDDLMVLEAAWTVLAEQGEDAVRVAVDWGRLTATGSVDLRSRVNPLVHDLEVINGVAIVDATDLRWERDDLTLLTPFV